MSESAESSDYRKVQEEDFGEDGRMRKLPQPFPGWMTNPRKKMKASRTTATLQLRKISPLSLESTREDLSLNSSSGDGTLHRSPQTFGCIELRCTLPKLISTSDLRECLALRDNGNECRLQFLRSL